MAAAMAAAMPPRTISQNNDRVKPKRTPELQKLYNTWQKEKEQEELNEWFQSQNQHRDHVRHNDNPSSFLRPPSQATSMSRSPSIVSTTYSAVYGLNNAAVEDDRPKQRARRNGPLRRSLKARAAFIRKLGACDECRTRRVKCNHYDLSDFHKEYQDSKPVIRNFTNSQIKQTNFNQSFEQPSSVPYGRLGDVSDLIGVGSIGNLASTTPQNTSFSLDAANIEFDEILDETRAQQLLPGSLAAPLYQFPNNRGFVDPTTVASPVVYSAPLNNVEALVSESSVPIGRLVDHYRMEWTCRGRDGQANSMIWGSEPETCNRRCRSLDELHNHFNQTHALIQDSGYATKCENCNIAWWRTCLYPQPSSQCPRCGIDRSDNWCYGSISSTPSLTSAPSSTYVESQDGSAIILPRSSTYPSTYNMNPTGSQNNSFMGSQGQSWGSYGGYYQARYASVVPVRPKNSRAHFQYSPDSHAADCAPFGKLSMTPPSSHYSSLYSDFTTRISSLKPALPIPTAWLLIMLLAILALIETWFPVAAVLAITNTTFGIGIEMLAACRNRILVFLVMCIAVGCVGMWLCKYTGICRTPEEAGISYRYHRLLDRIISA